MGAIRFMISAILRAAMPLSGVSAPVGYDLDFKISSSNAISLIEKAQLQLSN
jgi:hypothetical protein